MEKLTKITFVVLMTMVCPLVLAQEQQKNPEEKPQPKLLVVHTDFVKPSMTAKYEAAANELNILLTKNGIKDVSYSAFRNDENAYMIVSPIKSMADLDKNAFATLVEKGGKENLEAIFSTMSECFNKHINQVVTYLPEDSYGPGAEEGENYRVWEFFYFDPAKNNEIQQILNDWKALYTKANIASGYRVYKGAFGMEGPVYIVVTYTKDPVEHATELKAIMETFGEEGQKLWDRTMSITNQFDIKTGYYLPQLSYSPPVPVASGN